MVPDRAPAGPAPTRAATRAATRLPLRPARALRLVLRRYHRGEAPAPTAEALMRSRYSAFAVGDPAYLRATWDPATRPRRVDTDLSLRWTGLEVLARTGGGLFDTGGTVSFRAHHEGGVVEEESRFRREGGRWLYVGPV